MKRILHTMLTTHDKNVHIIVDVIQLQKSQRQEKLL